MKKIVIFSSVLLILMSLSSCFWETDEGISDGDKNVNTQVNDNTKPSDNEEMKEDEKIEEKMKDEEMKNDEKTVDNESMRENDNSLEIPDDITEMNDIVQNVQTEIPVLSKGIYQEYNSELLASSNGDIVLFFHATWCPSCKATDENISSNTIPDGINVLKVDYDSNNDLRKKYGITTQHTFVQVDNKGNMIKKWIGSRDIEAIQEKLK